MNARKSSKRKRQILADYTLLLRAQPRQLQHLRAQVSNACVARLWRPWTGEDGREATTSDTFTTTLSVRVQEFSGRSVRLHTFELRLHTSELRLHTFELRLR